jgi:ArsR family transcriptional regulator
MGKTTKLRLTQEQFDAIARAVADPRRFAILKQVSGCSMLACGALQEHELLSRATISHHMKELGEAGLIDIQREGRSAKLQFRRDVWKAYVERLAAL